MSRFEGEAREYRFTEDGSYKQWTIVEIQDNETGLIFAVTHWGRVGNTPQGKFHSGPSGVSDAQTKVQQKHRKGYEYFTTHHQMADTLAGLDQIPYKIRSTVQDWITARQAGGAVEVEVVRAEPVSIAGAAQNLVSETISLAHSDTGAAVTRLNDLRTTVAAMRAELEQVEAGAEIADAVVRKTLEA